MMDNIQAGNILSRFVLFMREERERQFLFAQSSRAVQRFRGSQTSRHGGKTCGLLGGKSDGEGKLFFRKGKTIHVQILVGTLFRALEA